MTNLISDWFNFKFWFLLANQKLINPDWSGENKNVNKLDVIH